MDASPDGSGGPTALKVICGSCDAHSTGNFCTECGTRLLPVTASAEYKQVTVLFADVVRSMDLAATLDIERLREVMTALMERSADVARRYGGGTVEYAGDGLMVIFGAPVALEEHAFRACLAALAMQEGASELAAEVQHRDGVTLQVRVGLNSGRVIAGEIASGTTRYAATGETVGFAHRMELPCRRRVARGIPLVSRLGTGVLVETLLERGADGDQAEALELVDWLANLAAAGGSVMLDLMLLRLRALMARSEGDEPGYRESVGRYGAMAESLGFDGHVAWAEEMTQRRQ